MRPSAEDQRLRHLGQEEEPLTGTEIGDVETERDVDFIDRGGKSQKLTESEWRRLGTCERQCSKGEWG